MHYYITKVNDNGPNQFEFYVGAILTKVLGIPLISVSQTSAVKRKLNDT